MMSDGAGIFGWAICVSQRRNRRNRGELAAGSAVEQPEADDTSRGQFTCYILPYSLLSIVSHFGFSRYI